jgi:glycosyltransferase involved in cell wall biosynthesis
MEMLRDGETGYLVSPTTTQPLTDALHILTANLELRIKMGQAGKLRLINNFTTDRYVRNVEALYEQLIS